MKNSRYAGEAGMHGERDVVADQYADGGNLSARIRLHERYSTNRYGWHRWVFDQIDLPDEARVLELGCGVGALWRENHERLPSSWTVVLSDFSVGMLRDATAALGQMGRPFRLVVADAQAIPFVDSRFHCVVANHMLYHVPDIDGALRDMRRVLLPGGRLLAATNGSGHLRELRELVAAFDEGVAAAFDSLSHDRFSLDTGPPRMARLFRRTETRQYEDSLVIPEAEPLVEYVNSSLTAGPILKDRLVDFRKTVEERLRVEGVIRVRKETGVIVGWK